MQIGRHLSKEDIGEIVRDTASELGVVDKNDLQNLQSSVESKLQSIELRFERIEDKIRQNTEAVMVTYKIISNTFGGLDEGKEEAKQKKTHRANP